MAKSRAQKYRIARHMYAGSWNPHGERKAGWHAGTVPVIPVPETRERRRARLSFEGVKDVWCAEFDSVHSSWPTKYDVRADSREEASAIFQAMSDDAASAVHGQASRIVGMVPKEDYTQ